jgi:hypothetical protein
MLGVIERAFQNLVSVKVVYTKEKFEENRNWYL